MKYPLHTLTMKTIFAFATVLLLIILTLPAPAFAAITADGGPSAGSISADGGGGGVPTLSNPLKNIKSVGALLNKFVEIVSYLLILLAVVMIVWTGMKFILARGNPAKLAEEGKRLGAILIGVAIVIGARILIGVIINTLQATGTVKPEVINSATRALDGK